MDQKDTEEIQNRLISLAIVKHDNKYDYSEINYKNAKTKVSIICPTHGVFRQGLYEHAHRHGCPKCKGEILSRASSDPNGFFKKAVDKYSNKYDYSESSYKNIDTKISIICPKHGEFRQSPYVHLRSKHGCPKCSGSNKYSQKEFLTKCEKRHSNIYNYSKVRYMKTANKIEIICEDHGSFLQSGSNHLKGHGCPKCSNHKSYVEDFVEEILLNLQEEFIQRSKLIIPPQELDFYSSKRNLAIECNGIYWHSELKGKDKNYHLNKTKSCADKGVQLIHIFESEIVEKPRIIKARLKNIIGLNTRKIYARKCSIKEISPKVKGKFLNKYHIQSNDRSNIKLGLFYKTHLVAVMTFCQNRKALGKEHVEGEWELSRYATVANFSVIGGAGKLLKHFEREYEPNKITTYADLRWSQGDMYYKLGFSKIRQSKPNYWYFSGTSVKLYHRFGFRKSELNRRLETFEPEKTEWQNMVENGWNRIWDCGNLVFEKKY